LSKKEIRPKGRKLPGDDSVPHESHTINEIVSQGEVWRSVLQHLEETDVLNKILTDSAALKDWIFVGCGTSFYLAEAAAESFTLLTGQPARAVPASETLLFPALYKTSGNDSRIVVVSRSGHTSEAVRAANMVRQYRGVKTVGITCGENTPLEKACDFTIVLRPADEKSMVMTRSFTSMLFTLQLLAARRAGMTEFAQSAQRNATAISGKMAALRETVRKFVQGHSFADYVFLGQGPHYAIAREGALKIMEMSCSYSQSFHTLEFRHGPKSIVSPATCLTFFLSKDGYAAEAEVLAEMKELGGVTLTVCNEATAAVRRSSDLVVELGLDGHELASLAPSVIPAQLLGYFSGRRKGLDPDSPKNLSRVVMLD
jgi:glutamine---fructose-6-phosphate transaminase (isomerizing)